MADPTPPPDFSTCSTVECGGSPYRKPVVLLYAGVKFEHAPISVVLQAAFCRSCCAGLKVDDFLGDDFKKSVGQVIQQAGMQLPDWSKSKLTFCRPDEI